MRELWYYNNNYYYTLWDNSKLTVSFGFIHCPSFHGSFEGGVVLAYDFSCNNVQTVNVAKVIAIHLRREKSVQWNSS